VGTPATRDRWRDFGITTGVRCEREVMRRTPRRPRRVRGCSRAGYAQCPTLSRRINTLTRPCRRGPAWC